MRHALFLVKGFHLRSRIHRVFVKEASVLVCDPSVPIEAVREVNPDATALAYFGSHMIPAYGENSTFYQSLREVLAPHRDVAAGNDSYGNYELRLDFDTYKDYADWINNEPNVKKYDGKYLDELWGLPPFHWIERTGRSAQDIHFRWTQLMAYWTNLMGGNRIANIGRTRPGSSVRMDAISVEADHIAANGTKESLWQFCQSSKPEWNIAWGVPDDHPILVPDVVMPGRILP